MNTLIRKIKHNDKSITYSIVFNDNGTYTEVKLMANQYNQIKRAKIIQFSETDFTKTIN